MIFVQRLPAPDGFNVSLKKPFAIATQFFAIAPVDRRQKEFDFSRIVLPAIKKFRKDLEVQFHRKCAYCESRIGFAAPSDIDWFRPCRGVAEISGDYLPDHYWAQAFAWENIYLSCPQCNRSKAQRFPVRGGRAQANANRQGLHVEEPMLLDPCADDPTEHLAFLADGKVAGVTDRGHVTVELLNLNRADLVKERERTAHELSLAMRGRLNVGELEDLLQLEQPYLALRRSLLRQATASSRQENIKVREAVRAQLAFDAEREDASTVGKKGLEHLRSRSRFIERVEIKNIGSIARLSLDLSLSQSTQAPCFALLGGNGVGKSTVLKCISLALAGPTHRAAVGVKARDLLRHGAAEGSVTVHLSGFSEPVEMRVSRRTGQFKFRQEKSRALILAYGSSRLLPRGRNKPQAPRKIQVGISPAKITSLFDPFLPLTDVSRWLKGVSEAHFDDAAKTLRSLLPIDGEAVFLRPRSRSAPITIRVGTDEPLPFEMLSDGYQSMLGLAADIMQMMYRLGYESMRTAQGVVLIDELGNHLHPAWRMRVVEAFRTAFPQVQFIFSTHDPLCLRGLADGEIALLKRNASRRVYALENLPSIQGLRVDQILTSEHFGLDSAVDPETDKDMQMYQTLVSLDRPRTAKEEEIFVAVKARLTDLRLLGHSWRERLALQAIDEKLLEIPVVDAASVDAATLTRTSVKQLKRILSVSLEGRPGQIETAAKPATPRRRKGSAT